MQTKQEKDTPTSGSDSSYAERIEGKKQEAKKKVFQKNVNSPAAKIQISDEERKLGVRMLPLLAADSFKALQEFENMNISDAVGKSFQPPPPSWFPPTATFGEQMAFKNGYLIGLQVIRLGRDQLIKNILDAQAATAAAEQKEAQS